MALRFRGRSWHGHRRQARGRHPRSKGFLSSWPSDSEVGLGTVIEDKHEGATHAAQDVCRKTLVQASRQALLGGNLFEAISCTLVEVLLWGFLRLHLQSAAHGIKGVGGTSANCDRSLSGSESSHRPKDSFVTLVWVEASDCVETSQLQASVANNP